MKDGLSASGSIGMVGPTGTFQYSGTVDSSGAQWQYNFYVGGQYVGSFTLYVTAAAPTTSTGMPVPAQTVQPGVVTVPTSTYANLTPNPWGSVGGVIYQVNPGI